MKTQHIVLTLALAVIAWSCQAPKENEEAQASTEEPTTEQAEGEKKQEETKFGVQVSLDQAISIAEAEKAFAEANTSEFTIKAEVTDVCQMKGCWMKLDKGDGAKTHVKFKDYALFMPFDLAGKQVIAHGILTRDTVSVDQLKHLAEDAGKSEEEIALITKEEIRLGFEADGVEVVE